jgi:RNA polymerase sigma factor (sigma-70 family)
MSSTGGGSVTRWIDELKSGDDAAAQHIWERYFDDMVRLARRRLGARAGAAEDEEDAALSAIHSLCSGIMGDQFPRLDHRNDLWKLLVTITIRKALDQIERQNAAKRGGGRVMDEAHLADRDGSKAVGVLDGFAGSEPPPELPVMVFEEYQRLHRRLGNDSLRLVLDLSLEGYTREEIAERMGCTVKTVRRKRDHIRTIWLEEEEDRS